MEFLEARALFEQSLRCLALSMEQIRQGLIDKHIGENEPMQDFLAEGIIGELGENVSVEDCLDYFNQLSDLLEEGEEHDEIACKLNSDLVFIADAITCSISHGFKPDLKNYASKVLEMADKLLPPLVTRVKSEKDCNKLLKQFQDNTRSILSPSNYELESGFSLPLSYLSTWFKRRYWGKTY